MDARKHRCHCRAILGRQISNVLDDLADILEDRYGSSPDDDGSAWADAKACGGRKGAWARGFLVDHAVGDDPEEDTAFDAGHLFGLMEAARAIRGR